MDLALASLVRHVAAARSVDFDSEAEQTTSASQTYCSRANDKCFWSSPFAMGLYLDNHLVVCGSAKAVASRGRG